MRFFHRQIGEKTGLLNHGAHLSPAAAQFLFRELAEQPQLPRRREDVSGQELQESGLPGAVVADEPVDAAGSHMEIYLIQRKDRTIGFRDLDCFYGVIVHFDLLLGQRKRLYADSPPPSLFV